MSAEQEISCRQITMDAAVAMMEEEKDYIILDVRNVVEFGGIIDWSGETQMNEGGPL